MALYDAMLELSDDQAITATAASENILDLVTEDLNIGGGNPMYLHVKVGSESFDSGADDGTLVVALVYDTVAPIDGSSIVKIQTMAVPEATLVSGYEILRVSLPYTTDEESIVGLYYTVAGSGNFTAGKIDAFIENGPATTHGSQVADSNI